jgi:hypothetical protein
MYMQSQIQKFERSKLKAMFGFALVDHAFDAIGGV